MRKYGVEKVARCAAAEKVLEHAVGADGCLVLGARLLHYWPAVHKGPLPREVLEANWKRLLEPAIAAGRVRRVKCRSGYYYGPADRPELGPGPKRRVRTYGKTAFARSIKAEQALRFAVEQAGTMVAPQRIEQAWQSLQLGPLTPEIRRWSRTLEPGIAFGRVRCTELHSHHFYSPADMPHMAPPEYVSDTARLVEATRRAESRLDSAVLFEVIAAELAADSKLALESELSVSQLLPMLVHANRLCATHVAMGGRAYYSTPTGPAGVKLEAMAPLDRRRRAIEYFWQVTNGRPFSTHAIQRYTKRSDTLRIPNDPPWGWTCALQAFERAGEVVRLHGSHRWFNLWAPAEPWEKLTEQERAERLGVVHEQTAAGDPNSLPFSDHNPTGFSRNEDMRALVLEAKRHVYLQAPPLERSDVLFSRPVSLTQIRSALTSRPELLTERTSVRRALQEAARTRNGMRESAIVKVGRIGRCTYYDLERTDASAQYFAFEEALHRTRARWLNRGYYELLAVADGDARGSVPIGPFVLGAQLQLVHRLLSERLLALRSAQNGTGLLITEEELSTSVEREIRERLRTLESLASERQLPITQLPGLSAQVRSTRRRTRPNSLVQRWKDPKQLAGGRPGDGSLVDYTAVMDDLEALDGIPEMYSRLLPTRLPIIRTRPYRVRRRSGARGRSREKGFDRPALISYAFLRWGGSSSAWLGGLALPCLGLVRHAGPFIETIRARQLNQAHAAAAAALGILDTPPARAALVDMLAHQLSGVPASYTHTTVIAAIQGLAKLPIAPIATRLGDDERRVLEAFAAQTCDDDVSTTAKRVLHAWEAKWNRDRLLVEL